MATPPPPPCQTKTSQSPSKKRKFNQGGDQDDGGSQDPGATPRSGLPSQWPALSIRPASFHLPSNTGLGRSSAPSLAFDRQSSCRSANPFKTMIGLQRLEKPVLYRLLDGGNAGFQQLPQDVRQLYGDVLAVTMFRTGI